MVSLKDSVDYRKLVEEECRNSEDERRRLVALDNSLDEKVKSQDLFHRSCTGMVTTEKALENILPGIVTAFDELGAGI